MPRGIHWVAALRDQRYAPSQWIVPTPDATCMIEKAGVSLDEPMDAFHETTLSQMLRERGIHRVAVAGVALEDSVRATVLGSIREGFETWLIVDASVEVGEPVGAADRALIQMRSAGAAFATAGQFATLVKHQSEPTALVLVRFEKEFTSAGTRPIAGTDQAARLAEQLVAFGCRNIQRSAEDMLA